MNRHSDAVDHDSDTCGSWFGHIQKIDFESDDRH